MRKRDIERVARKIWSDLNPDWYSWNHDERSDYLSFARWHLEQVKSESAKAVRRCLKAKENVRAKMTKKEKHK